MRSETSNSSFSVRAISGTRSVILAMNAKFEDLNGFLGFAIGLKVNGNIRWLNGFKCFKELNPDPKIAERFSTSQHPIQDFRWGHYWATPDTNYNYIVRPLFRPDSGNLSELRQGEDLEVVIKTESEEVGKHSVLFNRGAIVSQSFEENFGTNLSRTEIESNLNDPNNRMTKWLSRGLLEGILNFISLAKNSNYSLHCCFYEISYLPVIDALAKAGKRGAKVEISYEAGHFKISTQTREATKYGISNLLNISHLKNSKNLFFKERIHHISIPHNKFIVLCENKKPIQVWTGSTNISASGFLGQSNTGHIVRDNNIAKLYFDYFTMIAKDSIRSNLKDFCNRITPNPKHDLQDGTTVIFSPRTGDSMLDWYGKKAFNAESSLIFTSAFGVTPKIANYFDNKREFLRYILMERRSRGKGVQEILEQDPNTKIVMGQGLGTVGSYGNWREVEGWNLEKWLYQEVHYRVSGWVFFIHTKFMAIDVMDSSPLVFTGSGNFSPNAQHSNDENMLIIKGNTLVSDVYTVEFFRLQTHFYFRQVANRMAANGQSNPEIRFLDSSDKWVQRHFTKGNYRFLRREMMGASIS